MKASDLVVELEARYCCVQGPFRHQCQTGEPYVVIGFEDTARSGLAGNGNDDKDIPGTIREGHPSCAYKTEDEACQAVLSAFGLYEADWRTRHGGDAKPVLYWRYDPPHAFWYDNDCGDLGRVKLRLVLSDRLVVQTTDDEYDAQRRAELADQILTSGEHHGQQER